MQGGTWLIKLKIIILYSSLGMNVLFPDSELEIVLFLCSKMILLGCWVQKLLFCKFGIH